MATITLVEWNEFNCKEEWGQLEPSDVLAYVSSTNENYTKVHLSDGRTRYFRIAPAELKVKLDEANRGGGKMFKDVKEYITKNRDFIFTLALLFLTDHFLLGGAMRAKLEGILHKEADKLAGGASGTKTIAQ